MKRIIIFTLIITLFAKLYAQDDIQSTQLIFNGFEDEEYITSPAVSFNGKYLVFVVIKDESYKFYECYQANNQWSSPEELSDITNFLGENTYKNSPVYNFDASKIYFAADTIGNKDIFMSSRTPNGWTKPVALPSPINTIYDEAEPSISSDDNTIFFVKYNDDRNPDCGTIYFSKKNVKHQWDSVKVLITPLNSGCERTPRILSDNKTLVFASKRDNNDFKLYYAKNLYADIWILPQQIGEFSNHDNLYPSVDYTGQTLYFVSSKNDKKSQIYKADLPSMFAPEPMKILTGKITDTLLQPVQGTINLLNPSSMVSAGIYSNNFDGVYSIFIKKNSNFLLDFTGKNSSHKFIEYNNANQQSVFDTINTVLFDSVTLLLKIYDKDIYEPIDANIKITDTQTNKNIIFNKNHLKQGRYELTIPIGKKYTITLTNPYIQPYDLNFDLSGYVFYKEFVKNIEIESQKIAYTFNVTDNTTNTGVQTQIVLVNLNTNQKITTTEITDADGNVTVNVRKGDFYDVTINPQGYAFYNTELNITDNTSKIIEVALQPLKQDVKIELNNITFETNSADLNATSYKELDKVVDLLLDNPEIKVEISAHTDDVGSSDYNLLLSERRAESVVYYLTLHNIPVNRVIFKGYGEDVPLVPNDTDQNRALNRRVELTIIEVN